jgi:hypothetical protein
LYTPPVKPRKSAAPEVVTPTVRGQTPKVRSVIGAKS